MKLKKASLTALMIFSLSACSSIEIIHVPVGCEGQPDYKANFTQSEAESMLDSAVDKVVLMRETYKARINAQCEINLMHDLLHADN